MVIGMDIGCDVVDLSFHGIEVCVVFIGASVTYLIKDIKKLLKLHVDIESIGIGSRICGRVGKRINIIKYRKKTGAVLGFKAVDRHIGQERLKDGVIYLRDPVAILRKHKAYDDTL